MAAPGPGRPYDVLRGSTTLIQTQNTRPNEPSPGIGDDSRQGDLAVVAAEDEDPLERRARLEAVLLMAKSPLSTRKLAQLARLADGTEARTMIRELNRLYDALGRALRVEQLAGGYRLMTRPALAPWLARLGYLPPAVRLSSPMMETLTVVAYRQPVSRADVEAIRGVACGELLRQLLERDLIRIAGRSDELGRPYLYGTTKRFLQLFGLSGPDALPAMQWQAWQDEIPDQETSELSDSNARDIATSPKESVVSTAVAPARPAAADPGAGGKLPAPAVTGSPSEWEETRAVIEDEEDEIYEGTDDDLDEDDFDDDWDDEDELDDLDDDDEDDELLDDEDEDDDDDIEDGDEWVEVGEDDWDEDDEDDEDDDWDEEDDDDEEEWV